MLRLIKMKSKGIQDETGYTLIEIMVVLFVLSLVISGLFGVFSWNFKSAYNGIDNQTEHENFRIFNANIVEELQFAKDIEITNETNRDTLSYTTIDGTESTVYFESDGLYKKVGSKKVKIASGQKYEEGVSAVAFEPNGMIHFNFFAKDINSLLFLSVKPIVYKN